MGDDCAVPLPNFLVVGAAKAGTTSLHRYLRAHPEVFVPGIKELNFFAEGKSGGSAPANLAEYERCFAAAGAARAIGEVSPRYLPARDAAERIARDLADVRVVVALREPVGRAWSDYVGRVRILREARPPAEALRPGEDYVDRGFYGRQLQRFYDRLPADRIHILLHEDLAQDTAATMHGLWNFLGVDPDASVDMSTRHNRGAAPRSQCLNRVLWPLVDGLSSALPPTLRGSGLGERLLWRTYGPPPERPSWLEPRLRSLYRDDIALAARLTGRDLSAWLV
jgi:hypothetical protein